MNNEHEILLNYLYAIGKIQISFLYGGIQDAVKEHFTLKQYEANQIAHEWLNKITKSLIGNQ